MQDRRNELVEEIFELRTEITRAWKTCMLEAFKDEALTFQQMAMLMVISEKEPVKGKDIAAQLQLSASAITQLVELLVSRGYVIREQDTKDRRIVYLRLSPEGQKKLDRLNALRREIFIASAKTLTTTELEVERTNSKKIHAEMQKLVDVYRKH